jgi:hypothetical protein
MEYFSGFPTTSFNNQDITNICVRLDFIKRIKENGAIFDIYQVKDGETPEDVALKAYRNADLFWIVLFLNNIIDPYKDWPMTSSQLTNFVLEKYGEGNDTAIHHYESTATSDLGVAGIWVDEFYPDSVEITNFEYEHDLNEEHRKIKILKPEYISQVIDEYRKELA